MSFYNFIRPLIFMLPEEAAHELAIALLKKNILPSLSENDEKILSTNLWGLNFKNPIGLAAGFDKNAEVIEPLVKKGFGFIETGTVTPLSQTGNPKPRLFRLKADKAIINRMGFNNDGADIYAEHLRTWQDAKNAKGLIGIVGANIGKNKNSNNAVSDYVLLLKKIWGLSDYITINISSPNTPNLRDLQYKGALHKLLTALIETKNKLSSDNGKKIPLLLKIAPDLEDSSKEDIANLALAHNIDGLIISNTTIAQREKLKTRVHAGEIGGLSGKPLFSPSTYLLRDMYKLTGGKIPLVGVGGVFSGDDAYEKIRCGASLIQLYTALIYEGFGVVDKIKKRLAELLKKDGFSNVSQAVGKNIQL